MQGTIPPLGPRFAPAVLIACSLLGGCERHRLMEEHIEIQKREIARLEEELAAAESANEARAREIDNLRAERAGVLDGQYAERQRWQAETDAMSAQLDELRATLEEQRTDALMKADAGDGLRDRVRELEVELGESHDRHARNERRRQELEKTLAEGTAAYEDRIARLEERLASAPVDARDDEELTAAAGRLREKLAATDGGDLVQVTPDRRGLRVILAADVIFQQGGVLIRDEAVAALDAIGHAVNDLPGRSVIVEGHTDDQPVVNLPYADNWGLGFARADAVRRFLTSMAGVAPDRIRVASSGSHDPIESGTSKSARLRNRRVEIVIGASPLARAAASPQTAPPVGPPADGTDQPIITRDSAPE